MSKIYDSRLPTDMDTLDLEADVFVFPASFAQQRLWFLDQLEPGLTTYTIVAAVRLLGPLQPTVLADCLTEIVQRHEVLRTTFRFLDGQPLQVISSFTEPAATLQRLDLSGIPEAQREQELHQQAKALVQLPFDLSQGPLLRTSLFRVDTQEHVLLLTMHHSISDGWSIGVFTQELVSLYAALSIGAPSPLLDLPLQYADYALWQRERLQGAVLEEQLTYWKTRLADLPALLALPTDHPRPAVQTFRGGQQLVRLETETTQRLKGLAQQEDATLFMALLAAFQILLAGYSGQQDIVVGTPIANRTRAEVEPLIGFFINTLVMRTDLAGQPTYREVIRQVRDRSLEAYSHQEVPFEQVVEAVQPERDLSRSPLFQVMFALQNTPQGALQFAGLRLEAFALENETAKFDLTLSLMELGTEIVGSLEYNSDLFDAETIARMGQEYEALVAHLLAQPEVAVERIGLLMDTQHQQVLEDWNATRQDWVEVQSVPVLLQEQAQQLPETIALVDGEQQVSYGELNRRANQLAHRLRREGIGPESIVGLCLERSVEQVVGMLGILKAGGAYVPLDPAYPVERLDWMLQDAQVQMVVTQQALLPTVAWDQVHRLYLDRDEEQLAREDEENPVNLVQLENLAYIIYTSGSTGKPKGTLVQHRGLHNLVLAQRHGFNIRSDDRVLQFASLSFDASISEIMMALTLGGTLYLASREALLPGPMLLDVLYKHQITVATLPPSVLRALPAADLPALCTLITAGEACSAEIVKRWSKGRTFLNAYGPTEVSVCATIALCRDEQEKITIGTPIANMQVYLLNAGLQPVPLGATGELYVGGIGVARGYLNRADLTAERFIPHPFSAEEGTRLYRTGDLARYLADGRIEFIGRADSQVKVRGYRIEPGEIEKQLLEHADIKEAVVNAWKDEAGAIRLVAYLVHRNRSTLSAETLRSFLQESLPEYMLPSFFVWLEALPLNINGKIDRKALPAPDYAHLSLKNEYVEPQTEVERELAQIWRQVLNIERVGLHDNFFSLGGDSILSIQIVSRAAQMGILLTPKHMFQHQTIARLATVVETKPVIEVPQTAISGDVPLTPIQHWFFEQQLPEPHHWNQAVLLSPRSQLDIHVLEQAIAHILYHHDALRLYFTLTEAGWQQRNAAGVKDIPLRVVNLSSLPQAALEEAFEAISTQVHRSFDLEEGSLLRAAYFTVGEGTPDRLLLVIHHLAVDGVSWRILLEHLQLAYEQLARGETVQLPLKTTSYQQWARKLLTYANSWTASIASCHIGVSKCRQQACLYLWTLTRGRIPLRRRRVLPSH